MLILVYLIPKITQQYVILSRAPAVAYWNGVSLYPNKRIEYIPHSVSTLKKIHIHLRNTSRNSMRKMPPSRSLK